MKSETINYQPLWSYPFVFRRIKRVDHEFGYIYQNGDYMPLKRNSAWCSFLFPWLKIGEWRSTLDPTSDSEYFKPYLFSDIDELSHFFARLVDMTVNELDYWREGLKNIANCGVTVEECVEFIGRLTPPRKKFFSETIQQRQKSGNNSINIQAGGNLYIDSRKKISLRLFARWYSTNRRSPPG